MLMEVICLCYVLSFYRFYVCVICYVYGSYMFMCGLLVGFHDG